MIWLRAAGVLALCLVLQGGLARLAPSAQRHLDLMMLPVIWYAVARSQRSAMLVGCAAGLLGDAWFHAGVFGLNGIKKTLLGWALGGIGSRFELNQLQGRFFSGVLVSLADTVLDLGLRRLLDQQTTALSPLAVLLDALLAGLLVVASFFIVDRVIKRDEFGRRLARKT